MEAVADVGREGFYHGPVAEHMVSALQQAGGLLTTERIETDGKVRLNNGQ